MKLLCLLALTASLCTQRAPSETPPVPDAGVALDASTEPSCLDAYNHQLDLDCPPPEDAHLGWVEFECLPKFSTENIRCVVRQTVCAAARGCYP